MLKADWQERVVWAKGLEAEARAIAKVFEKVEDDGSLSYEVALQALRTLSRTTEKLVVVVYEGLDTARSV